MPYRYRGLIYTLISCVDVLAEIGQVCSRIFEPSDQTSDVASVQSTLHQLIEVLTVWSVRGYIEELTGLLKNSGEQKLEIDQQLLIRPCLMFSLLYELQKIILLDSKQLSRHLIYYLLWPHRYFFKFNLTVNSYSINAHIAKSLFV